MNKRVTNEATSRRFEIENRIAEVLQSRVATMDEFATASQSELLHELSVYHQELEFQNEELRSVQFELEAIKNRYADLFDHAPYGYVVIDSDMFIQLANQTVAEMLGTTPKTLAGASLTSFIDPASQDAFYFHARDVFNEQTPQTTELVLKGYGRRVPVRVESLPDYQSGMLFARMAFIDISRERATLEALRASETRYRLLIEMADDIVLVCSQDQSGALDRIVEVNNAACARLGYDHDQLIDMPLAQVIDGGVTPSLGLRSEFPSEQRIIFETGLKPFSAPTIPVEIHASLFNWRGQPMVLLVARDISQRLKLEAERREIERHQQEMQKWQSLGALASGVAHDFNNLMTAIANELEVIRLKTIGHGEIEANIRRAQAAVRRGVELTAQMLAYTGQASLSLVQVDLNQLVMRGVGMIEPLLTETQKLHMLLAPQLPHLYADEIQIEQVILALLTNAVEALGSQPGDITVSTSLRLMDKMMLKHSRVTPIPDEGHFVCLQVQDSGAGMDEETLHRLFEPFFTTRFAGRGLGMAAVRGIVRSHHGAIFVSSQVGRGTTVCLLLPVVEEISSQSPRQSPTKTTGIDAPPTTATVLVVEDEEILRETCQDVLDTLGYRTLSAAGGKEAIQVVAKHGENIDCVLLDLTMPGMSGVETYHALRSLQSEVPIIITSGHDAADVLKDFPASGVAGYIQKPYSMQELHTKLQQIIVDRRHLP